MSPSPQAIAAIRAHVSDWTPDDTAVAAALNAPAVANPIPQAQVPNVLAESALVPLLNDPNNSSLSKLLNWVNFALVKADIDAGNRSGMLLWVPRLELLGIITSGEATNVTNYLNGTTPDPGWQAQISWAVANLGRPVDSSDIAAAREA